MLLAFKSVTPGASLARGADVNACGRDLWNSLTVVASPRQNDILELLPEKFGPLLIREHLLFLMKSYSVGRQKSSPFYSFAASDSQSFLRKSPTIPHNNGSQRGIRKLGFEYDHAPERTAIASPSGPKRNATE